MCEPHNNYFIFTEMPREIYWNERKDFLYQREKISAFKEMSKKLTEAKYLVGKNTLPKKT